MLKRQWAALKEGLDHEHNALQSQRYCATQDVLETPTMRVSNSDVASGTAANMHLLAVTQGNLALLQKASKFFAKIHVLAQYTVFIVMIIRFMR